MNTAEAIKAKFTLRDVAALCGIELPRDGIRFRSPFRLDQTPSCTVSGGLFTDWSRDEKLDAIGFFAAAKTMSNGEAFKELARLSGCGQVPGSGKVSVAKAPPLANPKGHAAAPAFITYPERIENPTRKLIERTAEGRGLAPVAFDLARTIYKTLSFGRLFEQSVWFLHDRRGLGYEARRCDGKEFDPIGNLGERKSHSKGRGLKSWPMGILPPGLDDDFIAAINLRILLVEGTPDYLAAMQIAALSPENLLPCAMLGKSADIAPDAMPHFKGRAVTIAGHTDARDRITAWAKQIRRAGAFEVVPVLLGNHADLNDWLRYHPDRTGELLNLLHVSP